MKFIAVQTGARRGYAVPVLLENAGMLECFYTDLAGNAGLGKLVAQAPRLPVFGAPLKRLAARRLPEEILYKTRTFGLSSLIGILDGAIGANTIESQFCRNVKFEERWAQHIIRAGYGNATHIYSMLGEGGPFVAEAYRRGLTVVSEIYILLSTERILHQERAAFPTWEPNVPDFTELRRRLVREDVLMQRTHFYICPSVTVQDDLVDNWGVVRERTFMVPYGMSPQWLELEPQPVKGRILFVGTADLRKGVHYLAMAAEQLKAKGYEYDFRVAGNVTDQVRQQPECRLLNFLGRVPRDRIHEEFQKADIFVLPSLAEGSAEVTYEALAAGVPLVVTRAAGSVARDGVEGRIIAERNPVALAEAIHQIVEDRIMRDRMAVAARERARDFTWEKYGERLVETLRRMKV
jgi:glycosyltransferase involved in cell wall biosynthesis